MDTKQAKEIQIIDFLNSINIRPAKISPSGSKAKYISPLRDEKNPSFEVSKIKNVWYDHGAGEGGTIIDLIMKIYKTDISGALKILASNKPHSFSFYQQKNIKKEAKTEIISIHKIINENLKNYLNERKINISIADKFLKEIAYKAGGNNYYAIGFKNDVGGFELRSKYFKSCTLKHITTVPGHSNNSLNIFEGFFDFLSALQLHRTFRLKYDSIVLNGVGNKKKVREIIKKPAYAGINLFLDNDPAGEKAVQYFKSIHGNIKDYSKIIYPKHNDLNKYLQNQ